MRTIAFLETLIGGVDAQRSLQDKLALGQFIAVDVVLAVASLPFLLTIYLLVQPPRWLLVIVAVVLVGIAGLLVLLWRLPRVRADVTLWQLAALSWIGALAVTVIEPWSIHVTPLVVLLPVVVAGGYLRSRSLVTMSAMAIATALAIVLIGRLTDGARLNDFVPRSYRTAVAVTFVPALAGLIAIQARWNHTEMARRSATVREGYRRAVTEADRARSTVERNLHDGAQQRLIAIAVNLGVARHLAREDPVGAKRIVRQQGAELKAARRQISDLANCVYPGELAEFGLIRVLRSAAEIMPVPTTVDCAVDRLPADLEASIYFCTMEALQNVARHAGSDARASIEITASGTSIRLVAVDDGLGFDPETVRSRGLDNLHDRVSSHGGSVRVESAVGSGTRLVVELPLSGRDAAPAPSEQPSARSSTGLGDQSPPVTSLRVGDPPDSLARAMRPSAVLSLAVLATTVLLYLYLGQSSEMTKLFAAGLAFMALVLAATRLSWYQATIALTIFVVAHWVAALTFTALAPGTHHFTNIAALIPVVAAVPFVRAQLFALMTSAVVAVAVAVAIVGRSVDGLGIESQAPGWVVDGVVIGFVPAVVGIVALHTMRNHRSMIEQADRIRAAQQRQRFAADDACRHLARELNGAVLNQLSVVSLGVQEAIARTAEGDAAVIGEAVRIIAVRLDAAISQLRQIGHGLYPSELAQFGLEHALRTSALVQPIPTEVRSSELDGLPTDIEATAYFLCHEALKNVAEHAGPRATARIDCKVVSDHLLVAIADDGLGLCTDARCGQGLITMADRVSALGGSLAIESTPGEGTKVLASLPTERVVDRS